MTNLKELETKIRKLCPELQELDFGCRLSKHHDRFSVSFIVVAVYEKVIIAFNEYL